MPSPVRPFPSATPRFAGLKIVELPHGVDISLTHPQHPAEHAAYLKQRWFDQKGISKLVSHQAPAADEVLFNYKHLGTSSDLVALSNMVGKEELNVQQLRTSLFNALAGLTMDAVDPALDQPDGQPRFIERHYPQIFEAILKGRFIMDTDEYTLKPFLRFNFSNKK